MPVLSTLLNGKGLAMKEWACQGQWEMNIERWKQPLALLSSSSPKSCAHPYQEIIDLIIGELRGRCQKHLNSLYFQFMKPFVAWYYGFIRFVHLAGNLLL